MENRYTKNFATCLDYAKNLRDTKNLKYIGTEMLIYGMLSTSKCESHILLGKFGCILKNYGYHLRKSFREENINNYTPKASRALNDASLIASKFKSTYVSDLHLLLAILKIEDSKAVSILRAMGIDIAGLFNETVKILKAEVDAFNESKKSAKKDEDNVESVDKPKKTPLDGFGYDLPQRAREQKIDPVIGRDEETERVIQTLSRKTKNNPVLVGEAGVGKSAVVEGLAIKIAKGDIPESLKGKIIFSLDLGGMVAGTKYRGEFESRFKDAIDYVKTQRNIILFIDEIHNLVGVGSTSDNKMDASEMIKPLLSRGEISIIGATTIDEYRKNIEKDPALERRFQPITVKEPTKSQAIEILFGLRSVYEAHHKVKITDEAIISAVNLSDRYIRDRFLPDKAIDLIDEASSKKRLESSTVPKTLKELELKVKSIIVERDYAISKTDLDGAKKFDAEVREITKQIKEERARINDLRSSADIKITEVDIKNLISVWTKIPVSDLSSSEIDKLLRLEEELEKRVIGQNDAVKTVVRAIKRSSAKLKDPNKPIGSFIFVGPTGVGKSELCKAIAECVFDDKNSLIRFDMSEYTDKTSINKLIGSAPGYVGYEEEGLLTEKIRRNPYSVVLFDEIEKADSEIFDLLLQVLDEGRLTDSKGRLVSFKDAIIVLTSNVGYGNNESKSSVGFGSNIDSEKTKIEESLKEKFRPEFINRLDEIVVFNKLTKENCREITKLTFSALIERVNEMGIELVIDDSAIDFIVEKGFDKTYGARPIKRAVSRYVEDLLSDAVIEKDIEDGDRVTVYVEDGNIQYFKD